MKFLLLLLLFAAPPKPTAAQYAKMLAAEQQVVNDLTNRLGDMAIEVQVLKDRLYGTPGSRVHPRYENEKPTCPVSGFVLQWVVEENNFVAYCVKESK